MLVVSAGATVLTQQPAGGRCDRACLNGLVDTYLTAIVSHTHSGRVPLAPGAKLVENVTPIKPGEGLWKTASGAPTTFRIYVPDPSLRRWASSA